MRLPEIRERAKHWQSRLKLNDWNICVQWGTVKKMKDEDGKVEFCSEDLSATVYIHPKCTKREETLVHELLHIVIEGDKTEDLKYDVHMERAINRIAAALCSTDANE